MKNKIDLLDFQPSKLEPLLKLPEASKRKNIDICICQIDRNNDIYTGLFIMNRDLGNFINMVPKLTTKFMKFMNFEM